MFGSQRVEDVEFSINECHETIEDADDIKFWHYRLVVKYRFKISLFRIMIVDDFEVSVRFQSVKYFLLVVVKFEVL